MYVSYFMYNIGTCIYNTACDYSFLESKCPPTNICVNYNHEVTFWTPVISGGVASPYPQCTVCREIKEAETCSA